MKKTLLFFYLLPLFAFGQTYSKCTIYEIYKNWSNYPSLFDTTKLIQTFNKNGQIVSENYPSDDENSRLYFYKDTLLIRETFYNRSMTSKDSNKILYYYNDKNKLLKKEEYGYSSTLSKKMKKYLATGDRLIHEKDLVYKKGKWKKESTTIYKYNSNNNNIEILSKTNSYYQKTIREYDGNMRVLKETYESDWQKGGILISDEYTYNGFDYQIKRSSYDGKGNRNTAEYDRVSTFKLDKSRRVIEETSIDGKGLKLYTTQYFYNSYGQILKKNHEEKTPGFSRIFLYKYE